MFWFTTTGWMMWNFIVGVLLSDASIVLFDGNPGYPSLGTLWDLAGGQRDDVLRHERGVHRRVHEGPVTLRSEGRDLSALRSVGSTGSPLSPEGFEWVYDAARLRHVAVLDLGRDRPVHRVRRRRADAAGVPGRAAGPRARRVGRGVGPRRQAADRRGGRARDHQADAVDAGVLLGRSDPGRATARATSSMYPGIWRHGDWIEITSRETAVIYGRSDSTINRGGVRMGTSRDLPGRAGGRRGDRRAGRRRAARGERGLDAAVRGAARGRLAGRRR